MVGALSLRLVGQGESGSLFVQITCRSLDCVRVERQSAFVLAEKQVSWCPYRHAAPSSERKNLKPTLDLRPDHRKCFPGASVDVRQVKGRRRTGQRLIMNYAGFTQQSVSFGIDRIDVSHKRNMH